MIKMYFDFHAPTVMGYSRCQYDESILDDYKDVDVVDKTVATLKKFFTNKNINNPFVELVYSGRSAKYDIRCRLWKNYDNSFSGVCFLGADRSSKEERIEKVNAKYLKDWYLSFVNVMLANEWEQEHLEEVGA